MTLIDDTLYYTGPSLKVNHPRAVVPAKLKDAILHNGHSGLMTGHFYTTVQNALYIMVVGVYVHHR